MKKGLKFLTIIGLFIVAATTLSSCTKSFCSVADKAQKMYSYEEYSEGQTFIEGAKTVSIIESATSSGMLTPSDEFAEFIENKVEDYAAKAKAYYTVTSPYKENIDLYDDAYFRGIALFGGSDETLDDGTIDYSSNTLWYNFDAWVEEARTDASGVGLAACPDSNFISAYKSSFNSLVSSYTTCISPVTARYDGITISGKTWKDAWNKGVIEGLLVYPVAWLIYTFATAFAGMGAFGTFLAIFLVTLIVRGILIALTFRQTLAQQKMTLLQPELQKIQAKYPNAQTNEYDKQRMGQEQMALYKKYKINPFGMIIIMIFQFPIFVAVWGAMQGSAILMSGNIFGLEFAAATGSSLINFKGQPVAATITAWVVFILMAAAQFLSMKIPQWIQNKKAKEAPKLGKNPSADQSQKTMKMVNNVMVIMIIVMGLQLPIAMSIYWFVSALISLGQSFLTQAIIKRSGSMNKKNKGNGPKAFKGVKKN